MGVSCELYPKVDGQDSKLYIELSKRFSDRPFTNLIYACYLQEGVAAQMDADGYKRNKQGEHNAEDVYKWFEVGKMLEDQGKILNISKELKSINSLGEYITYDNIEDALEITTRYNNKDKGVVAYTAKQGDKYIIVVEPKNSLNQIKALKDKENYIAIQTAKQLLNEVGLSLDSIINNPNFAGLLDMSNIKSLFTTLSRLRAYDNTNLSVQDIEFLLTLNQNDARISRLISRLGVSDIKELSQMIYDNFRSTTLIISSEEVNSMIKGLLDSSKKFNNLDIIRAIERINSVYTKIEDVSYEHSLQKVIDELNAKYDLDDIKDIITTTANKAKNAKELTSNIITLLTRQLKELEEERGITEETINLEERIIELKESLDAKRYYFAFTSYLSEVSDNIEQYESLIREYNEIEGSSLEQAHKKARILNKIKSIYTANNYILGLLAHNKEILKMEGLSEEECSFIQNSALASLSAFETKKAILEDMAKAVMLQFTTEIIGETGPNGIHASAIVNSSSMDSSIWDYLYDASKMSDPKGVVVGTLIRRAQDSRDLVMRDIQNRISRATYKLRKAGITDTSFMYESNGYIISDIDWKAYWKARRNYIKQLKNQGLDDIEMKVKLEEWEYQNTEERIVDTKNNRAEVVPNSRYRKEFPKLTAEQKEYYDAMMQIKGEMGTLLPNVAQKQYVPPQIRRDFKDAISEAKGFKDIWNATKEKIKGIYTIWEDDADFTKSGILIDDEEFVIGVGSITGNIKNKVPIRYINRIQNQEELLKDFSGAIQMFAGMAINYNTMNEVSSSVEFIYDNLVEDSPNAKDPITGDPIVEKHETKTSKLVQFIKKKGTTKTAELVREIIDTQVYGVKTKNQGRLAKFVRSFLKYNAVRALAVNIKGAMSNLLVGELNALIEAGSGEYFDIADYIWAKTHLFGNGTHPGKIVDFVTNTQSSYETLLADVFDPLPGRFNTIANKRYYSSTFKHLLGSFEWTPLYSSGESILNYTTMYAILHKEKVLLNGEKVSLYKALSKAEKEDGVAELIVKEGVTDLDGNPITINSEYIQNIRKKIRTANESMHGAMSEESKGVIHRTLWGKAIMSFRQWMVEFLSKRFRADYIDGNTGEIRRGYYRELLNMYKDFKANDLAFVMDKYNKEKNPTSYYNRRRMYSELLLTLALLVLKGALDEPEERKGEFWYRMLIYQVDRAYVDITLGNPIGIWSSMLKILDSPIPSVSTLTDTLYPITGLTTDLTKEYKRNDKARGIKKGDNVYFHKLPRKALPFWKHIEDIGNFSEDDSAFKYFN